MTRQEILIQAFSNLVIDTSDILIGVFEGTLGQIFNKGSYVEVQLDKLRKLTLFCSIENGFIISYYDDSHGKENEYQVSKKDLLLIPEELKTMMIEVAKSEKAKNISKSNIEYLTK